jgi:hypothetical protein
MEILAGLALFCLLIATFMLARGIYVWDAALLLVASTVGLGAMWLRGQPRSGRAAAHLKQLVPRSRAGWARSAGLGLAALVALTARARLPGRSFADLLLLWLLALGLTLASLLVPLGWRGVWSLRLTRVERWGLLVLLTAAGLARGVAVGRVPANLGGDEGTQLVAALELMARPLGNPFATGWYSVPTMSFLLYGIGMRLFGATVAGGRMLSVLVGTSTVLTTYLLGRAVGGRRTGWIAAAVMAFAAYHVHYSRLASNQIFDPLIGTAALWLVWRAVGLDRESVPTPEASAWLWGLCGVVTGLGWSTYFGGRWVTVLVALVIGWRAVVERDFLRRHGRGLGLLLVGWLVVGLPLLGWTTRFPGTLTERTRAVSIFGSGWLAREMEMTGRSSMALVLQQAWRAVSAFHATPDPTFWYRPEQPLLDFVSGALMLLGLIDAVVRIRRPSRLLAHLWFWPTLVVAWVITENPPSSQRGLLLLPVVVLFITWGMELLLDILGRWHRDALVVAGTCVAVIAVLNLTFYFGVYTPVQTYGNPTAQSATAFARYAMAHPEPVCATSRVEGCAGRIYFLGPPFIYWQFGTLAFMLRDFPGEDVTPDGLPLNITAPARFVVVPERIEELAVVRALYPGGAEVQLRAPDGRLLMVVYDWE